MVSSYILENKWEEAACSSKTLFTYASMMSGEKGSMIEIKTARE